MKYLELQNSTATIKASVSKLMLICIGMLTISGYSRNSARHFIKNILLIKHEENNQKRYIYTCFVNKWN